MQQRLKEYLLDGQTHEYVDIIAGWDVKIYQIKTSDFTDEYVMPKAVKDIVQGLKQIIVLAG